MTKQDDTSKASQNGSKPEPAASASATFKNLDERLQQGLPKSEDLPKGEPGERTMGRMLGEMVWLMTQSPAHKHFSLADLEWMVMPPLALGQYRIFRNGEQPLGVALWAYLNPESEQKLEGGATRLMPQEWAQGMRIDPEHGMVSGEGGTLWLIDIICPGHTAENKLADICLHDLMTSVFKGQRFKMFQIDPETRMRKVVELVGL
jgi:cytolysin-activating lysine-acyltransferase